MTSAGQVNHSILNTKGVLSTLSTKLWVGFGPHHVDRLGGTLTLHTICRRAPASKMTFMLKPSLQRADPRAPLNPDLGRGFRSTTVW